MRFILVRAAPDLAPAAAAVAGARLLLPRESLAWPGLPADTCFVIPLAAVEARPALVRAAAAKAVTAV
jgi:cyclic beta-1,2-glucan synthetase